MVDTQAVFHDYLRNYLISLDANKTAHSGRTLYEHLKGVHDLLRDWDNPRHVCLAGLFHSIYGTNTFKHVSLRDRGELVKKIGLRAETLVHLFSTADRPFFNTVDDKSFRRELLEIEAANLFEQGGNVNILRKLSRMRELSDGAKAALNSGVI